MADHRIIVQIEGGGSSGTPGGGSPTVTPNPVVPSPKPPTAPDPDPVFPPFNPHFVVNPIGTAKAAIGSFLPWVAAVAAVAQVCDKVITTLADVTAVSTGDTYFQTNVANFHAKVHMFMTPVSTALSSWKQSVEIEHYNRMANQQAALLGEAQTNSIGTRGF